MSILDPTSAPTPRPLVFSAQLEVRQLGLAFSCKALDFLLCYCDVLVLVGTALSPCVLHVEDDLQGGPRKRNIRISLIYLANRFLLL